MNHLNKHSQRRSEEFFVGEGAKIVEFPIDSTQISKVSEFFLYWQKKRKRNLFWLVGSQLLIHLPKFSNSGGGGGAQSCLSTFVPEHLIIFEGFM